MASSSNSNGGGDGDHRRDEEGDEATLLEEEWKAEVEKLKQDALARYQLQTEQARVERRAAMKRKLEEDRRLLQANLEDPFAYLVQNAELVVDKHLLKYLDTPSRVALCKASPSVKKLWGPKKDTWTLSEALMAVPQLHWELAKDSRKDGCFVFGRPLLRKVRSMCRDWRWAVDNFYDKVYGEQPLYSKWEELLSQDMGTGRREAGHFKYDSSRWLELHDPAFCSSSESVGYFGYFYQLRQFDDEARQGHDCRLGRFLNFFRGGDAGLRQCPVISKAIEFDLGFGEERSHRVSQLLNLCGQEIRYADIMVWRRGHLLEVEVEVDYVEMLRRCLESLPNVNGLSLDYCGGGGGEKKSSEVEDGPGLFPPLPHLVFLKVEGDILTWRPDLMGAFGGCFDQLHTLIVELDPEFLERYDPHRHSTFPNLQRVNLMASDAECLLKLRHWRSALKEVHLVTLFTPTTGLSLYALERFHSTLVAIKIEISNGRNTSAVNFADVGLAMEEPSVFTLPNLKILSLGVGCGACDDLEVLLKLSHSPRHLEINSGFCRHPPLAPPLPSPSQRRLQLYGGYFDKVWESNAWDLLPALGKIVLNRAWEDNGGKWERRYFTRKEFEAGQRLWKPRRNEVDEDLESILRNVWETEQKIMRMFGEFPGADHD